MEQLQIKRTINNQVCLFTLTEDELTQAYRIKQRQYMDEDFANALSDNAQDPNTRFHVGNLEEFPELTTWLYEHFDHLFDANMAHNDLIELTLNHLEHSSLTPEFFEELARIAPAMCEGVEKRMENCEQDCSRYYRCGNIVEADDRSKKWELLSSLLSMHRYGTCDCSKEENKSCPASKYLSGAWDISDFFHTEMTN